MESTVRRIRPCVHSCRHGPRLIRPIHPIVTTDCRDFGPRSRRPRAPARHASEALQSCRSAFVPWFFSWQKGIAMLETLMLLIGIVVGAGGLTLFNSLAGKSILARARQEA